VAVSWVVVPCNLAKFTDVSEVLAASIINEAVSTSETSINVNQATRCNTPEDSRLQVYFSLLSVIFTFPALNRLSYQYGIEADLHCFRKAIAVIKPVPNGARNNEVSHFFHF
jgi:hypothetical protein